MENKITAVEWLLEKYKSQNTLLFADDFEQAKEMEKQQIIKAYMNVNDDRDYRLQDVILKEFAEQYYNEEYNK